MSDKKNCCSCKPHRRMVTISLFCEKLTSRLTGKKLEESVFMISGSREKICGISTGRKYVGVVDYQGLEYMVNYRDLFTCPRTRCEIIETDDEIIWHVRMGSKTDIIIANIRCSKEGMDIVDRDIQGKTAGNVRSFSGQKGCGFVKIYQRDGEYCTLIDDIEVEDVVCGFGVVER